MLHKDPNCFLVFLFIYICMGFSLICMSVYYVHSWYPLKQKEEIRSLGMGVMHGCEALCEF